MRQMKYEDAVREGLAEEMRRDKLVWALGEDLSSAHDSTSSRLYYGLIEEFGAKRIVNTPISESTIMGAAVGAALNGTRPVADLRQMDFGLCAIDELVNQAAKIRYMFGGQASVPLVVRQYMGIRRGAAAQHSQSLEAWFVHVPGLVVVVPATPADGKGLLKSSIRCDDPVCFFEHKELWTSVGDVPDDEDYLVPLGKANVLRPGQDLTIVAWSQMSLLAKTAAEALAREGVDAEVIDLRTLWPWDQEAVLNSVRKTGRLLVCQEAVKVNGFAAEVAMVVMEELASLSQCMVKRIGAPRIPVPYSPSMESEFRVTDRHIIEAAQSVMRAHRHDPN